MSKRQASRYRRRELTLVSILVRDDDWGRQMEGGWTGFRIWVYVRRISGEALSAERRLAPDSRAVPLVGGCDVM